MTKEEGEMSGVGAQEHQETRSADLDIVETEKVLSKKQKEALFLCEEGNGTSSAPQSRTCSFRNRPRPKLLHVDIDLARRCSLPSPTPNLLSVSFENIPRPEENVEPLRRVRSFKTTTKGLVNRGDSFKRSSNSISSTGSAFIHDSNNVPKAQSKDQEQPKNRSRINSAESKDSGTAESTTSSTCHTQYRAVIVGAPGVGKTSLTNQFMTSEYVAFENDTDEKDDSGISSVTVLLDSEESTLDFIERSFETKEFEGQTYDAFGIVYSITDRVGFRSAVDLLQTLRHDIGSDRPIILIGNKIDLVRKRKVPKEEGRAAAIKYETKYIETSAALNHHVDELLAGLLSQIRLKLNPKVQPPSPNSELGSLQKSKPKLSGPRKMLDKLFRKSTSRRVTHKCENLHVL